MNILDNHLKSVVMKTWNFSEKLKTAKDHYMNASLGLVAEAGEVADVHKKFFFHDSRTESMAKEEIKLELGDVCYYLMKVAQLWNLSIEEILAANKAKLMERYPENFK